MTEIFHKNSFDNIRPLKFIYQESLTHAFPSIKQCDQLKHVAVNLAELITPALFTLPVRQVDKRRGREKPRFYCDYETVA
jgi:hypothetical protein